MSTRYAANTEVPADRSKTEIERTLTRYGANAFMYGWDGKKAVVSFRFKERYYRLNLEMPSPADDEFTHTPTGKERHPSAVEKAWEQAGRQRWRALALYIKATLEAVESGIITMDQGLMPYIVLPDNRTLGEWAMPQITEAYKNGKMPALMPGVS